MSLEAAIQENTATLKALITVLQSAAEAAPEPEKAPSGKGKKEKTFELVEGDPEGTRYVLIKKHKTASRILPGETFPSIEGQEEIGGVKYLEWKDTYAKLAAKAGKDAASTSSASTPASDTPAASTATSTASDASPAAKDFPTMNSVVQKLVNDHSKGQGKGREEAMAILKKYGAKNVQGLFDLGKYEDVMTDLNKALGIAPAAAAEEEFDPFAS